MKNDAVSPPNHRPLYTRNSHNTYLMKPKPGHVSFRVVCDTSIVGLFIGKKGSGLASIYRDNTSVSIHCHEPVPYADHRVISVIGPSDVNKTMVLHVDDERTLECQVSCTQEALIRVFERLWGLLNDDVAEVFCGLLADSSQVGYVMGKGGKNVSRMRAETGAHITILPPPSCAAPNENLIQIVGPILAAKKALAAVSCCLQECPPLITDNAPTPAPYVPQTPYVRPAETSDPHAEFFPNLSSLLPAVSNDIDENEHLSRYSQSKGEGGSSAQDSSKEVSFRLLCSTAAAGGIIGRKGIIVRALQNQTSASICFSAPGADNADRVVTISAMENLESRFSGAQNAVILVFARSIESEIQKGLSPGSSKDYNVTARLLVPSDFVGCLIGNKGRIIAEIIDSTDTDIQIMGTDHVGTDLTQNYNMEKDVVVQNALFQVTSRLRNSLLNPGLHNEDEGVFDGANERLLALLDSIHGPAMNGEMDQLTVTDSETSSTTIGGHLENEGFLDNLLPSNVLDEVGRIYPNGPTAEFSESDQENILPEAMGQVELSENMGSARQPKVVGRDIMERKNGVTSHKDDLEVERSVQSSSLESAQLVLSLPSFHSEKGPAARRNTYVEIPVSKRALVSLFGVDSSILARLSQVSGAKVEVSEPSDGRNGGMIFISGMSDEVRAAQSFLLASLLSELK
ncbi:hypothetical protein ACFE04_017008 [Oxalis oulophora]